MKKYLIILFILSCISTNGIHDSQSFENTVRTIETIENKDDRLKLLKHTIGECSDTVKSRDEEITLLRKEIKEKDDIIIKKDKEIKEMALLAVNKADDVQDLISLKWKTTIVIMILLLIGFIIWKFL